MKKIGELAADGRRRKETEIRRFRRLTQKEKEELATDTHRRTQTFIRRTSLDKNGCRFAKRQRSEGAPVKCAALSLTCPS